MDENELRQRLDRIETLLTEVIIRSLDRIEQTFNVSVVQETYTVEQAAERLNRSEWTVREWCRLGQVPGARKVHGRGRKGEWRIPHESLIRIKNEGVQRVD